MEECLKVMNTYEQKRLPYLLGNNYSCGYNILAYQGDYLWTTLMLVLYQSDQPESKLLEMIQYFGNSSNGFNIRQALCMKINTHEDLFDSRTNQLAMVLGLVIALNKGYFDIFKYLWTSE